MKLRFAILLPLLASVAVAQVSDLTLRGVMPPPPPSVNVSVIGTPGATVRCYYVEAIYAGGNVVNGQFPACVTNANNTLTGSNFVNVGWTAVTGATGYNVIVQTAFGTLPASCTSCVVTANTASTTVADNGGALTNYTATGFANPSPTSVLRINNTLYATPRVELTLWPFQIISGSLFLGTPGAGGTPGILHNIASITGTLDNTVEAFTDNTTAVNFFTMANSAAGNPLILSATGTDTNIGVSERPKGTGTWDVTTGGGVQFQVLGTPSAVNNFTVAGTGTGVGPTLTVVGTDAAIPVNIRSKGTGGINFLTNGPSGNNQFQVLDTTGTIINRFTVTGNTTTLAPTFAIGTTTDANVGMTFTPKGTGSFTITPTTNTNPTAVFVGVASAINGYTITPGAAGTAPSMGIGTTTDANVGMTFTAKGVGPWVFNTQTANNNGLTVTPGATTVPPIISVNGTDANVAIQLTPKGTGALTTAAPFTYGANVPTLANAAGVTLTAAQILNQVLDRSTAGAGQTDAFPTAAVLVAGVVGCAANTGIEWAYRNRSANSVTLSLAAAGLTSATGNTLTVANGSARSFVIQFTNCTVGAEAVTVWSIGTSVF